MRSRLASSLQRCNGVLTDCATARHLERSASATMANVKAAIFLIPISRVRNLMNPKVSTCFVPWKVYQKKCPKNSPSYHIEGCSLVWSWRIPPSSCRVDDACSHTWWEALIDRQISWASLATSNDSPNDVAAHRSSNSYDMCTNRWDMQCSPARWRWDEMRAHHRDDRHVQTALGERIGSFHRWVWRLRWWRRLKVLIKIDEYFVVAAKYRFISPGWSLEFSRVSHDNEPSSALYDSALVRIFIGVILMNKSRFFMRSFKINGLFKNLNSNIVSLVSQPRSIFSTSSTMPKVSTSDETASRGTALGLKCVSHFRTCTSSISHKGSFDAMKYRYSTISVHGISIWTTQYFSAIEIQNIIIVKTTHFRWTNDINKQHIEDDVTSFFSWPTIEKINRLWSRVCLARDFHFLT